MNNVFNYFKLKIIYTIIFVFLSFAVLTFYLLPNHILLSTFSYSFLYSRCPEVCDPLSLAGNIIFLIISGIIGYLLSHVLVSIFKK